MKNTNYSAPMATVLAAQELDIIRCSGTVLDPAPIGFDEE